MAGLPLSRLPGEPDPRQCRRRHRPQPPLRLHEPALVRSRRLPRDRRLHRRAADDPRAGAAGDRRAGGRRAAHRRGGPRLRRAVPAPARPLPGDGHARLRYRHRRGHPEPRPAHPGRRRPAGADRSARAVAAGRGRRALLPRRGGGGAHDGGGGEPRAHAHRPRLPGDPRERDRRRGQWRAGRPLQDDRVRALGLLHRRGGRSLRLRGGLPLAGRLRRVPLGRLRGDDHRRRARLGAGLDRRRRRRHRAQRQPGRLPGLPGPRLRRHPHRLHAVHAGRRHPRTARGDGAVQENVHASTDRRSPCARAAGRRRAGGRRAGRQRHRDRAGLLQLLLRPARLHRRAGDEVRRRSLLQGAQRRGRDQRPQGPHRVLR